jgi:hypothetical protein
LHKRGRGIYAKKWRRASVRVKMALSNQKCRKITLLLEYWN